MTRRGCLGFAAVVLFALATVNSLDAGTAQLQGEELACLSHEPSH
jgi:hypothetical protein